jgi:predicted ATPase/DNA-binding CsgD family transcriptional regulator
MAAAQFIGRERELAALDRCLDSARLLTVTGPGGCGKTGVAGELARRVASRAEPLDAVVVELINAATASEVVDAALRAFGAREQSGRTPIQILLGSLAERQLLLVLDNCEQLTQEFERLVSAVLGSAPGVRVLVTSRVPIGIAGEVVFQLGALSLPGSTGAVASVVCSDAGRFFVDRAAKVDPGFALTPTTARAIARICQELDGLPLALELAAARIKDMSAMEIADGLSRRGRLDAPRRGAAAPQHRSMRASLDWSYGLLDARECVLLRRLSVFAGGWTAEAARAIALPDASETYVRGLLNALEAKGLIVAIATGGRERWSFLQTVAEYAAGHLALDPDIEQVRDRHVSWFCAYAAEVDGLLLEPAATVLVEAETPNLRLALAYAVERDASSALNLAASLTRHWILAERFEEGRAACVSALSVTDVDEAVAARALVLCGAGLIGALGQDYERAVSHTQAGLTMLANLEDVRIEARCLQMAGMTLILTGLDPAHGLWCANRAVELLRSAEDPLGRAWAVVNVAMAAGVCDRFDAVREAYEEFLTIPGAAEHPRLRTWAELAGAWGELIVGSPVRALAHADMALALEGDRPSMTWFIATCHRVHALALLGRADDGLREGRAALDRAHESGALMAVPAIELALAVAEFMHGDFDAAVARAATLLEMPQVHTVVLMRELLARVALSRGDAGEAGVHGRELSALAESNRSQRHRMVAELILGCVAVLEGEHDRGRDCLQKALATAAELGLERGAADALDELGMLATCTGDTARAARLAGAASAVRERVGYVTSPSSGERMAAARQSCIDRNDQSMWDEAWAQGEALALKGAIAYALRGRGPRKRPPHGWPSLTPAELEVAELAASGMSNPQIAAQLFMSRSTVKMHLSNVYLKLQIANRTQLAAARSIRVP